MRFPHLMVSALTASGLILSGCSAVDCSDLDLESDFEAGSPCFEDYERPTELDIEQLSTADASISHNNGQNCMSCHQANGPGMGQFTAAGTVHKVDGSVADPGSIVGIYADPTRQAVIAELEVDQLGNVYTTEDLGLGEVARAARVSEHWAQAVGPEVASHSRPEGMRNGVLEISADSSVWCQHLQMNRPRLLAALREQLGEDAPEDLRFRVGYSSHA